MNEKFVSAGVVVWSLPLAWAVQRNTGNTPEAGLWLLMGLWMSWRIWKDWPAGSPQAGFSWRVIGIGAWALCAWIVSGLWPQDHGIIKPMLLIMSVTLIMVLWGPGNLHKGWRVLLIAAFWVTDPFSFVIEHLLAGPRLESLTAGAASLGLWQAGFDVTRTGAQMTTEAGSIIVKYGCTAIPLWSLLFHLLIPAALVFELTWRQVAVLGTVALISGFLISAVRVMIIALVVNNDARFHYWHGDEGANWFSLIAFFLFAAMLVWQARLHEPVSIEPRPRPVAVRTGWFIAAGMALSILALVRMLIGGVPAYPSAITAPAKIGPWALISTDPLPLPSEHVPTDRPTWIKQYAYIEENTFAAMKITLAAMPVWLDGDPLILASFWGLTPAPASPEPWELVSADPDRNIHVLRKGTIGWLASIHGQGAIISESKLWIPISKKIPRGIDAWFDWLLGRYPLRQKDGVWVAIETSRGSPLTNDQAAAILAEWRDRYLTSKSTH